MNAPFAEMRRLHDRGPNARGLVVDTSGVMLGPDCVLAERTNGNYRRINSDEFDRLLKTTFGHDHGDFRSCSTTSPERSLQATWSRHSFSASKSRSARSTTCN